MISMPTVLILGAGASAHCGYPLGTQLVSQLCGLRQLAELDSLPEGWARAEAVDFLTRLSRSGHYSIDSFLEKNPNEARLGKYLIASVLKKYERIDRLFPPHDSGWYQYLFNTLLSKEGKPDFAENKLSIITFNYDRSLEAYLFDALLNRFRMSPSEATAILASLKIIHVHGILGAFPAVPYSSKWKSSDLLAIADQIQIIHEINDNDVGFCNPMFESSHHLLKSSENIYFMGFGFHPDNLRRFQFFSPENTAGINIKTTTCGLAPLDIQRLEARFASMGIDRSAIQANGASCNQFFSYTASLE